MSYRVDYRLPQNRKQAFIRWYAWSLLFGDCDPAIWMMQYLNDRFEHNSEQRIWFCWLYGNTYNLATAWILLQEFPDYELATVDRLTWWNDNNYKRLRYQTDTKYNKGYLPQMFASYQKAIGSGLQRDKLESFRTGNLQSTFTNLWKFVNDNYYKFGRYTTWFYLQVLHHTATIPMEPTSLMLSDFHGSASHRNGLLYALELDHLIDLKLAKDDYIALEDTARAIQEETKAQYPKIAHLVDPFSMETALCAFKKIWRVHHGRYLGYYLDRQAEEIEQVEKDGWAGIDWDVLWQARQECLDSRLHTNRIQEEKYTEFVETGWIDKLDWLEEI